MKRNKLPWHTTTWKCLTCVALRDRTQAQNNAQSPVMTICGLCVKSSLFSMRIESPHINGQLIYDKRAKNIQWRKMTVSPMKGVGKTEQMHAKKWNWTTILHHVQKLTQNVFKTWTLTLEAIKLLEEKTDHGKLLDIWWWFFWIWHQKQRQQKQKWTSGGFCTAKKTINKMKRQPTEWKKICINHISDKGLISKIHEELIQLSSEKTNNPIKNGQRIWRDISPKNRADYVHSGTVLPGSTVLKNPPANAGEARDSGSIPGSGRSPGGENGSLLQYSCLENPMDRGAWRATYGPCGHRVRRGWVSTHSRS